MAVIIGGNLTCEEVLRVARFNEKIVLDPGAPERIAASRAVVDNIVAENRISYGITTGVGKLCNTLVSPENAQQLQVNISISHACGFGDPLREEEVRAIMLIRANIFTLGFSGVSIEVVEMLIEMLNAGIHPVLPKKGGIGSSGSLSIGAHLAKCMRGEGDVFFHGQRMESVHALERAGIKPYVFKAKEGLSMLNGTHAMCGIGILAYCDIMAAIKCAEITAAISLEALTGNTAAFDLRVHNAKKHPGQMATASNILRMIDGSDLYNLKPFNVQDAYSFRCLPQTHGAAREILTCVKEALEREINSASDNPIVIAKDGAVLSNGNFHGQLAAIFLDNIAIAGATIAKITERRISRLVDPQSSRLPDFLIPNSGINSGYMIPQYLSASLTAEIKLLANPVSTDSIPTSGGQEDVVSNGTISANKAREVSECLAAIVGVEMICAAQALELSGRENYGKGTGAAYACIREIIPKLVDDRVLEPEIIKATGLVSGGKYINAVETAIGALE